MGVYWDHNIPDAAHTFIGNAMGSGGLGVIAFPPGGGWVGVAENGVYEAHGIPQECFDQLAAFRNQGWKVRCIAFPSQGGNRWVIIADQGYFARNIPDDCYQKIGELLNGGSHISCVAFPPGAGDAWVIVANNAFWAHNINDECYQFLCNYRQGPRVATQVTFAPNGGWTVYGGDTFYARNIDNGCYQQMVTFNNQHWLIDHVAFTPGGGYSIVANNQNPYHSVDPIRQFEGQFFQENQGWHDIWSRMTHYGVPGASVALVQENKVAWRTSYGKLQAGLSSYVYANTPFQAASVSKPHCAAGVMRLVQDALVALDDPIGDRTTWPVAVRGCGQADWRKNAKIQAVLQHKGGFIGRGNTYPLNNCVVANFTAGGGGFGGYPDTPGVTLPTLDQVLAGTNPPANSPKIELSSQPGTFYYSGMGFVVLMRMLQDVTHADFKKWMKANILDPTGMTDSTFEITLPANLSRAAAGHDTNGNPIPGLRNRYPESSAAGLYTNAGDLCRFVAMINNRGKIDGHQVLASDQVNAMLTNQLGIFTVGGIKDKNFLFNHNGGNYGFSDMIQGYPNLAAGMAVMTNLDDGASKASAFYGEAFAALKRIYNLP